MEKKNSKEGCDMIPIRKEVDRLRNLDNGDRLES